MRKWINICEDGRIVQGVNTTADVKPGETKRQAAKFGNKVGDDGCPPIICEKMFKHPIVLRGTMRHSTYDMNVYVNPTLSDIVALCQRFDLRGVTDGQNVFVSDARHIIHSDIGDAALEVGLWKGPVRKLTHNARTTGETSCYFYSGDLEQNAKAKEEWVGPSAERLGIRTVRIAPDTYAAFFENNTIEAVRAFSRLLRNAEPVSFLSKPKQPSREELDQLYRELMGDEE